MSLTYAGYRLIIGGVTVSNDLIQKGSYSFVKQKRIATTFQDSVLTEHQQVLPNRKVVISFSLRERNLAEQDSIKGIFDTQDNISVTYWDDYTCSYQTGTFYMTPPQITHRNTVGGINYSSTPVTLTEY